MADLDDAVEVDSPDLSDVALMIVNVETSAGRQLTFMVGAETESDQLAMTVGEAYGSDDQGDFQQWTFTLTRRS